LRKNGIREAQTLDHRRVLRVRVRAKLTCPGSQERARCKAPYTRVRIPYPPQRLAGPEVTVYGCTEQAATCGKTAFVRPRPWIIGVLRVRVRGSAGWRRLESRPPLRPARQHSSRIWFVLTTRHRTFCLGAYLWLASVLLLTFAGIRKVIAPPDATLARPSSRCTGPHSLWSAAFFYCPSPARSRASLSAFRPSAALKASSQESPAPRM
jgi:hypothetical protein